MLNYTSIDFETANSYRGSPCSVGLIRVRDGRPVEEREWLIRPPEGADHFDAWNTAIHGITAEMVSDAPRWKDILPQIVEFIGEDTVVAHNAAFDIGVIRYACALDSIPCPPILFLCTLVMARQALELPTYRLPFVVDSLGLSLEEHHNALADAKAVVGIIGRLAEDHNAPDIDSLAAAVGVKVGELNSAAYQGCLAMAAPGRSDVPLEINTDADPSGYLYGRVVVFTGALKSMTRPVARLECARIGAIPEKSTTKRTNVLVVGDINPAFLRPSSKITGKARRAFELQDEGQAIEIMTEDDFLRCLDGNSLDGIEILLEQTEDPHETGSHNKTQVSSNQRSVPLSERVPVEPARSPELEPPKPLRRTPVPTTQVCSIEECSSVAAFKTRTKPTWCEYHVMEIQRIGGLKPLESFTHPNDCS